MSIDWSARREGRIRRLLSFLERISLALERPLNRLVGDPRLNPLYHTGTITVFLLLIIAATGVYLTMFYQFGFAGSYRAVSNIEASPVGRVIRALHRYASDLAVIMALLHGWRTFFQNRFRGPRWLAWVTGVGLATVTWVIGISGYWLISDARAQLLNQTLVDLIGGLRAGVAFINALLVADARGAGWLFTLLLLILHVGLSVVIGLVFWLHIRRLSRPKWLPPRHWLILVGAPLLVAAIAAPVGMLASLSPARLPGWVDLDLFFLFYLPPALRWSPAFLWGSVATVVAAAAAIPWLLTRKPLAPVVVHPERCSGCTLCAADCPYRAISMVERTDGRRHKYVAAVDPKMCVACGVCIGTCTSLALTLGDRPAEPLWEEVVARARVDGVPAKVVFVCDRHASQGARAAFAATVTPPKIGEQAPVSVIPLTCIAMAHPDLAERALQAGAAAVHFVGCPPEDCANREGNVWMQGRLERKRLPRLDRRLAGAPIASDWLPPDDFGRALQAETHQTAATAYGFTLNRANWRMAIPPVLLLGIVLAAVAALGRVPFQPYTADQAMVEIALEHRNGNPVKGEAIPGGIVAPAEGGAPAPTRLVLEVDGATMLDSVYGGGGPEDVARVFERIPLTPGIRHIRLHLTDRADQREPLTLADQTVTVEAGQVLLLHFRDGYVGGNPAAGRALYFERVPGVNAGCRICHSLDPGVTLVGPSLAGIGTRAETRVPGMSAKEYLYQSLVDSDAYVVEGFRKGQMPPTYKQTLTEEQIQDLVAFLMTLR